MTMNDEDTSLASKALNQSSLVTHSHLFRGVNSLTLQSFVIFLCLNVDVNSMCFLCGLWSIRFV